MRPSDVLWRRLVLFSLARATAAASNCIFFRDANRVVTVRRPVPMVDLPQHRWSRWTCLIRQVLRSIAIWLSIILRLKVALYSKSVKAKYGIVFDHYLKRFILFRTPQQICHWTIPNFILVEHHRLTIQIVVVKIIKK